MRPGTVLFRRIDLNRLGDAVVAMDKTVVERMRIELTTFALRTRRSPS